MGAIHSTKISGNFGPKLNGSVRSNRKSFEKTGSPFEVVLFSRSDRLEFWSNGSRPICKHLFQKTLSERTANGSCRTEIARPKGTVVSILMSRELKQPRRRQLHKHHKFAYLTVKNSIFARFARAFFIF